MAVISELLAEFRAVQANRDIASLARRDRREGRHWSVLKRDTDRREHELLRLVLRYAMTGSLEAKR